MNVHIVNKLLTQFTHTQVDLMAHSTIACTDVQSLHIKKKKLIFLVQNTHTCKFKKPIFYFIPIFYFQQEAVLLTTVLLINFTVSN